MELFNPFQCFVCVFLWCLGNYVTSADNVHNTGHACHRVQREFVHRKIGPVEIVPDNPIFDAQISVCNSFKDSSKKSCCTRQSELKYISASEKYLTNSIRTKNAYLKKLVMDHITQYRERIFGLIHLAKNKTGSILTELYNIPPSEHNPVVLEFYTEVEKYMKQKNVRLFGAVATFFDKLFPAVYKNTLNDGTIMMLTEEHRKCLQENRQEVSPPAFGFLPYNISQVLNRGLSVAKTYLDVLALIVEAVNTTDHVIVNEQCKHHVTKLQYCSHCQLHVDVKPCKKFCLHSLRGCLGQLSILTPEWEGLIRSLVKLDGGMSRGYEVEKVLENLDRQVDSAVLQAMSNEHLIDRQIKQLCKFPVMTKPTNENQDSKTSATNLDHHNRKKKRSIGGELYDQVLEVMKELLNSQKMYNTIAGDICRQEIFYDQDKNSQQCWNGTAIGRYDGPVDDIHTLMKGEMYVDPKISALKDKLVHMRLNLMTKYSGDEPSMQSDDETIFGYPSGSNWGDNPGYTLKDDEDYDTSGNGSGNSGDGPDEVTARPEHQPPYTNVPPRKELIKPGSSAPPVGLSVTITTTLTFIAVFCVGMLS